MRTCVRVKSGECVPAVPAGLLSGNVAIIDAAARELPGIDLADALRMLVVMAKTSDPRYAKAAARWVARATTECALSLEEARRALALAEVLPAAPDAIEPVLRKICG